MTDYLEGAKLSYENSIALSDAAHLIHDDQKNYPLASFLLYTATEEMLKGLYCAFVHIGWMHKLEVNKGLREHDAKTDLHSAIANGFEVKKGTPVLNGSPIYTITDLTRDGQNFPNYMQQRNAALYVELEGQQWISPSDKMAFYADEFVRTKATLGMLADLLRKLTEGRTNFSQISFKLYESNGGVAFTWFTKE